MDRKRQDLLYRVLGAGIVISQLVPFIPRRPELLVVASGLLGLPTILGVKEAVDKGVGVEK